MACGSLRYECFRVIGLWRAVVAQGSHPQARTHQPRHNGDLAWVEDGVSNLTVLRLAVHTFHELLHRSNGVGIAL